MSVSLPKELSKAAELSTFSDDAYEAVRTLVEKNVRNYLDDLTEGRADTYRSFIPPASKDLIEKSHRLFLLSFILGMDHAADGLALSDFAELVPDQTVSFEEAVKFASDRVPLTREEFYSLSDKVKFRAFTVARLTQIDAIEKVRRKIVKHLESADGENLRTFLEETETDEFIRATGMARENPWYWENVYRTNIQTNYNAGRALRFEKNPPRLLEFIGIEDSRQTGICEARSGTVRPYADPWWRQNWPPLHFQCRSTVRGIYAEEAKARGLAPTRLPSGARDVQAGFGGNPLDNDTFWKPTSGMRERIARQLLYGEVKTVEEHLIGGKEEVPIFKTVKQAEDWAISHNIADQVNFKGAKPDVARQMIQAVYDSVYDHPKLRSGMKFIGTSQERNRALREHLKQQRKAAFIAEGMEEKRAEILSDEWAKRRVRIPPVPSHCYAQSVPGRGGWEPVQGISINSRWAKSPDDLLKSLKHDVSTGYHPPGTDSIKAITDHEIGHQLDDLLEIGRKDAILELYDRSPADVRALKVSAYGATDKKEFIAEAWAEYRNAPQPRETARIIGELILKEWDAWEAKR